MECPSCGIISPPDTRRCDCGYEFRSGVAPAGSGSADSATFWKVAFGVVVGVVLTGMVALALLSDIGNRPVPQGGGPSLDDFTRVLAKERCGAVTRSYFMGRGSRGVAAGQEFWSVACSAGPDYQITRDPDGRTGVF